MKIVLFGTKIDTEWNLTPGRKLGRITVATGRSNIRGEVDGPGPFTARFFAIRMRTRHLNSGRRRKGTETEEEETERRLISSPTTSPVTGIPFPRGENRAGTADATLFVLLFSPLPSLLHSFAMDFSLFPGTRVSRIGLRLSNECTVYLYITRLQEKRKTIETTSVSGPRNNYNKRALLRDPFTPSQSIE